MQISFETPEYTANADGLGTLRLLESIRLLGMQRWHHKISFDELVAKMVAADLKTVAAETSRQPVLAE